MENIKAILFDLDGTLLDNNEYHFKSWKRYLEQSRKEISDEDYKENISGRTNKDAVEHIYGKQMSEDEAAEYYLEKEKIYREMFAPVIAPIKGLPEFLEDVKQHNILMAIATSGIQVNIDFMFQHVPIKQYFETIVKGEDIENGKPEPDIFLKTAERLGVSPNQCVVFEDSTAGVQAGKAAGMKVVALTTTHTKEELHEADLVITDYTEVDFEKLKAL